MTGYLQEGTLRSASWQKIVNLIYKLEIKQKLLDPVNEQFYRALLEDKDHKKYIAVGLYDKNKKRPIIEVRKWSGQ